MPAKRDFTDRMLRALKPAETGKRVIHWDAAVPGFGIRVTDKCRDEDKGTFVLVARFPGSSNPTARRIGEFPATSLADARDAARVWREDIRRGVDPKVKEAERQAAQTRDRADTFSAAFETYADDHLSTLRTGAVVAASVRKHVFPAWGEKPLKIIRRAEVLELIRSLKKDTPITANRMLAYIKHFFGWAVDQDILEASPAANVKRQAKESKRDRVLTEAEIKAFWEACGKLGAFGRAFRMMLVTGQRRSEVAGMARKELDLAHAAWGLGRDRTKADRSHDVPLSKLALEIIAECPDLGPYLFSSGRSGGDGKDTMLAGWSKAKTRLDQIALIDDKPLPDWHLHDLRRTCATYLAKLGTDRIIISKILNHAEGGVTGVYDRHGYETQKRDALEAWGVRIKEIVGRSDKRMCLASVA